MSSVFVVDACRTPIGKVKGALADVRPDHLAADILKALVARNPDLDVNAIDDVYWGAANQAGEDNRNVARMAVLLAGLPVEIPGATVNRLCGSGMEAVSDAARAIAAGDMDIAVAGGTESMTRAPFVVTRSGDSWARNLETADTRLGWRLVSPRMQEMYPPISLGETAENVADKYGITRERQDQFALRSHHRAAAARDAGRFDAEIVPVTTAKGETDQRRGHQGGHHAGGTGGQAAGVPQGRLGHRRQLLPAQRRGRVPAAHVGGGGKPARALPRSPATSGAAAAGVHPDYMGIGPVPAMNRVLARAGWRVEDLDLVELNEAFAAQSVACVDELKLDPEKVNVNGGAIAIGHPLGCSGARIVTTLLHEMRRRGGDQGRRGHVHRRRPGHRHALGSVLTNSSPADNFCYPLDNC